MGTDDAPTEAAWANLQDFDELLAEFVFDSKTYLLQSAIGQ
jgi:hypothetical protein